MLHRLNRTLARRGKYFFSLLLLSASLGLLLACSTTVSLGSEQAGTPGETLGPPATGSAQRVAALSAPRPTPALMQVVDDGDERRSIELFEQISPSVVHVHVEREGAAGGQSTTSRRFLESHEDVAAFRGWISDPNGGSGFVLDTDGRVLTTNRLVADAPGEIEITFADGTQTSATVVGGDPNTDLAVLKVEEVPEGAAPLQFADSDDLRVGQRVAVVGNPLGYGGTMTTGIVSAKARNVSLEIQVDGGFFTAPDLIQTDAAVTAGMVGGPLVDLDGQVVGVAGIDTLAFDVAGQTRAGGVSLSIPTSTVKRVVPSLIEEGRYPYPWLGISATDLTPELAAAMDLPGNTRGVLVVRVTPDSPAAKAGLQTGDREIVTELGFTTIVGGDVIVAFQGQPVRTFDELVSLLFREGTVGETVSLTIIRDGEEIQAPLTLEERP